MRRSQRSRYRLDGEWDQSPIQTISTGCGQLICLDPVLGKFVIRKAVQCPMHAIPPPVTVQAFNSIGDHINKGAASLLGNVCDPVA